MTEARGGLYLEDLSVGQVLLGPSKTITEDDIAAFAALTGDDNALHTDAVYAQQTMFGQRIAHGLLGLSIAAGLACQAGLTDNTLAFTGISWKFKSPVFIGDTVTYRATIARIRPMRASGGGMVFIEMDVLNQNQRVVQTGQWSLMIKSRPTSQAQ